MKKTSRKKIIKRIFAAVVSIVAAVTLFSVFSYVHTQDVGQNHFQYYEYGNDLQKVDYVIVPGAGTKYGEPTEQQKAHLDRAIQIYAGGLADKILLSGGDTEVKVMKKYLEAYDISPADIFMDSRGIDTYNTIKRANDTFEDESMYFCTLPQYVGRAGYIIDSLDMDGKVVNSNLIVYQRSLKSYAREYFAATKALLEAGIFKSDTKYDIGKNPITAASQSTGNDIKNENSISSGAALLDPAVLLNNITKATSEITFEENLSASEDSSEYDADAAVAYARKYFNKRNGNYPEFSSNCTNFVSQCLVAGGMKMTGSPDFDEDKYIKYDSSVNSWYCSSIIKKQNTAPNFAASSSFLRTKDFVDYWTKQQNVELFVYENTFEGRASLRENTKKGDIFILYDTDENISHIGIISDVSDTDALYCANTMNRLDFSTSRLNDSVYPKFAVLSF